MRQFCMAILFVFASMCLLAQITNIKNSDSTLVIHQLYAGVIQETNYSVDSLYAFNKTNFRIGSNATYTMHKNFAFNAFFALDQNSDGYTGTTSSFTLKTRLGKKFVWVNGFGAQASTFLHRPPPPTFSAHFEPWAKAQVPGGGIISRFEVGTEHRIIGSVAKRKDKAEFHLGFSLKNKFLTSVWVNDNSTVWGGAVTLNLSHSSVFAFFDQDKFGSWIWVDLSKNWGTYFDFGFSRTQKEIVRGELGFLKSYKVKTHKLGGFVGIGYSYEQRFVRGYFIIALSD